MVPAITNGGRSFKGASLYYLHDKRQAGEAVRLTDSRVAWTEVLNLPTDDPDLAWRMMADTASCQAELKRAAGIKATGRKLESPVFAYSLSWDPSERPSAVEQLSAARETLKALGLDSHQALIVSHNDEPHPHVHVMVNRVHAVTGVAAKLSKSKLALSVWAQAYEERNGHIFCTERVENNARRQGLRPGRAADNRSRRLTRAELEAGAPRTRIANETRAELAEAFGQHLAAERHGQRRRAAEKDALHQARRDSRKAVRERQQATEAIRKQPTDAKQAARLADQLMAANPALCLAELTRGRSTFTRQDMVRLVGRHTDNDQVFKAVLDKLETSSELVRLGKDERGRQRFTTVSQQEIERAMERHARLLHGIKRPAGDVRPKWAGQSLSAEQDRALRHVLATPGLAAIVGFAGSGKSTLLNSARQSWEAAGFRVRGAALSGIAADGLAAGAGIDSRTIHSRLYEWEQGQGKLTDKDVLVIDEAGMIGSRQMEHLLRYALEAKAKVVLVGDAEQLQAIEAGAAFRAIVNRVGAAELRTVRRQKQDWQKEATFDLATGNTKEALRRYEAAGMMQAHDTDDQAKAAVVDRWAKHRQDKPAETQIILAYTRLDVRALNDLARARLREEKALGPDQVVTTEFGKRAFATGDRLYFLKNDRAMGVRNGSLGTVEHVIGDRLTVRLDGAADKVVTFSTSDYGQIDHGYAATIHKSQGVTVDRAHLLASRNLDRHSAYVAMTRHRDRLEVHWSKQRFQDRGELERVLSRQAAKDTSLDYGVEIDTAREAKRQAAAEMRERVIRRARNFADRERTPAGRMKNARSLAGADASVIDVARLALNGRARKVMFKQQQATLKKWAKRTEPTAEITTPERLAERMAATRKAREIQGRRAAPVAPRPAANDIAPRSSPETAGDRHPDQSRPAIFSDASTADREQRQSERYTLAEHDAETVRLAQTMNEEHAADSGEEAAQRAELQLQAAVAWAALELELRQKQAQPIEPEPLRDDALAPSWPRPPHRRGPRL